MTTGVGDECSGMCTGVDIKAVDRDGADATHIAIDTDNEEVCDALLLE